MVEREEQAVDLSYRFGVSAVEGRDETDHGNQLIEKDSPDAISHQKGWPKRRLTDLWPRSGCPLLAGAGPWEAAM